jgi:ABC-2 type transport system permease protein
MRLRASLRRTAAVTRKEVLHILRDPTTLFFALFIPIVELLMLGYAVDMNVRRIRTAVLDQARTQESRALLDSFANSDDFALVAEVFSDRDLSQTIVAGKARVGIKVPEDYSRRLQAGETAQVLVLVDGSESSMASEAVNVSNAITLRESIQRVLGDRPLPIVARPRVLFNPDTRSANFFIPGLLVILCQVMAVLLTANAVVREKENDTLEQLFMMPVRAGELIAGKLLPYLALTFVEFCGIVLLMRVVFAVPIHGSFFTLLALMLPFALTMLGVGLLISTQASTREAANQLTMAAVIPSIFLSGYVFPVDSMPLFFQYLSQLIPTTWLIDAVRGVVLRGAGWAELWRHVLVLTVMAMTALLLSTLRFRKRLF